MLVGGDQVVCPYFVGGEGDLSLMDDSHVEMRVAGGRGGSRVLTLAYWSNSSLYWCPTCPSIHSGDCPFCRSENRTCLTQWVWRSGGLLPPDERMAPWQSRHSFSLSAEKCDPRRMLLSSAL